MSMLHDRSLMPHVAGRGGTEASVALADDEWMSASPIYTDRNKANLGITGDGVDAVLKSFQFDIGTPHHFLDMEGEVVNHDLGYFWLVSCGAHAYVRWVSGNDEKIVTMMCHEMEDNTFEATLRATNPRARCVPVHRPPKPDTLSGEHCRWELTISPDDRAIRPDHPNLAVIRASSAANFEFALGDHAEAGGLDDYSGAYTSGLRLEDFSHAVLVRQVKEFALDVHLLMRSAYLSILERHGDEVLRDASGQHLAALAPPLVKRLSDAMGIDGEGLDAIAKLLQLNPLLPDDYTNITIDFADDDTLEVTVLPCAALEDRDTPSPIDAFDDDEPSVLSAIALAVNPRARIQRHRDQAWHITIDPDADPVPEHPLAGLVGGHNYFEADMRPRAVPVSIT
ncbi:MAG: hypothetical protein ACXWBN_13665 [Acidimicrobiales bacterium]